MSRNHISAMLYTFLLICIGDPLKLLLFLVYGYWLEPNVIPNCSQNRAKIAIRIDKAISGKQKIKRNTFYKMSYKRKIYMNPLTNGDIVLIFERVRFFSYSIDDIRC